MIHFHPGSVHQRDDQGSEGVRNAMASPIDVARRHDEAWNAKDADARIGCYSADVTVEMPGGMVLKGPDQVRQVENVFWTAIPDSELKPIRSFVDGDTVIVEGVMTGTQTGPFRTPQGEIPPSGNSINLRYVGVKEIAGEKVASEHLYFDQMEFMAQIGALPQRGSA
jgi:steroid delta-isomerase-like uncharacterized protein